MLDRNEKLLEGHFNKKRGFFILLKKSLFSWLISVVDFKIAGDGGETDFVHTFFDGHMDGVGLVGDEGVHILEGGYKGDIVRSFAM